MGGGEGGASDDSQPMMIDLSSMDDLNQQPRSEKRKRESSELFHSKDKGQESDSLLCEFKEKVNKLRSKRSMKIMFNAKSASEAYYWLDICTDPRGFDIKCYCPQAFGVDAESDMNYLRVLSRLVNSPEIEVAYGAYENSERASELVKDISVSPDDLDECVTEYCLIYRHSEVAAGWKGLKVFLMSPDTEREYYRDPPNFEQKLRMDYKLLSKIQMTCVVNAFASWWTSRSEQDKDAAMTLITCKCEDAQEYNDSRLQYCPGYLRCDYLKLKLDVARRIGIIDRVHEEIEKLHIPDHYEWSPEDDF